MPWDDWGILVDYPGKCETWEVCNVKSQFRVGPGSAPLLAAAAVPIQVRALPSGYHVVLPQSCIFEPLTENLEPPNQDDMRKDLKKKAQVLGVRTAKQRAEAEWVPGGPFTLGTEPLVWLKEFQAALEASGEPSGITQSFSTRKQEISQFCALGSIHLRYKTLAA